MYACAYAWLAAAPVHVHTLYRYVPRHVVACTYDCVRTAAARIRRSIASNLNLYKLRDHTCIYALYIRPCAAILELDGELEGHTHLLLPGHQDL